MAARLRSDHKEPSEPQTEDSAESGYVEHQEDAHDPVTYRDMGQAEELGQDDVGDIADEGPGHRG